MRTLESLFFEELEDILDAETRLIKALPRMAKAATDDDLRQAFEDHYEETRGHVEKVGQVFQAFGRNAKSRKCPAMEGLVKEGDELAAKNHGAPSINAALISAAQKVEHYEMASYGCLRAWAKLLGNQQAAALLEEILGEEKAADHTLTELAQNGCNESAQGAGSEEDEASDDPESPRSQRGRPESVRASTN